MTSNNSWKTVTFAQLIEQGLLQIGDGYRAKNVELGGTGPIFLRAGHVTDETIDFKGVERFHVHLADRVRQKMSQVGDAVITTKGNSTGRVTYVHNRLPAFVYSPHLSYWRSTRPDKIVPRFLYYWSRSAEFVSQLRGMSASTDMAPYLSLQDQRRLIITLPAIEHQNTIANVLGALDDKIELNRRMNETLEAMARALFQSWFIDFDPVHAKAAVRRVHPDWTNSRVSRAALPNLDPTTAELFPDRFEDSTLGLIPANWNPCRLSEITTKIGSGATPTGGSKVYVDQGVALIRSQNVHDHRFVWEGLVRISDHAAETLRSVTVEPDDVLLNITGDSILRTCVVEPGALPARVNQHVSIIRPRSGVPSHYLHLHLVRQQMKDFLLGFDSGGSRKAITKGHLEGVPILLPSPDILSRFGEATNPLFARIHAITTMNRTLAANRDALLPKLLSGELRVHHPAAAVK